MTATAADERWQLACPTCRTPFRRSAGSALCAGCGASFACEEGIWRFLPEARLEQYARFLREYQTVRAQEGWGSQRGEYYRSLPRVAPDDPQREIWRRRERSYHTLLERVVTPATKKLGCPLAIIDAGAGNCWLSHRLSRLGHQVLAVDLSTDDADGLGAARRYEPSPRWTAVQAEFDRLPLAADQADLLIFNGAFHYSSEYITTAREAMRVLRPDGDMVVMDSPLYHDAGSGFAMVAEREEAYQRRYGFRSNAIQSEHFLTYDRLEQVASALDLHWRFLSTGLSLRSAARRWWLRARGHREPAAMPVMVATRTSVQGSWTASQ